MFYHLDFYQPEEIAKILKRSSKMLKIDLDEASAGEIARRSRGTPRVANRLLRRVRDWVQVKTGGRLSKEITSQALDALGIDNNGLDLIDRKVLKTILDFYNGGPVGIESLAATLNEESDTIVDMVEPFLLKAGFLKRTPRGRELTNLARRHLGAKEVQKELF